MNIFFQAMASISLLFMACHAASIAKHLYDIDLSLRMLVKKKDQEERFGSWEDSE